MLFTSYEFIAFLGGLFILYYLIPKKFQWILLLAGSVVFYAWAGIRFLAYIGITTVTTWFAGTRIAAIQETGNAYYDAHKKEMDKEARKAYKAGVKKKTRVWFLACLLFNLGILAVIKYTDFVIDNINAIFSAEISFVNFALPLGISFYTFKSMGYLIDVYRSKAAVQKNLAKFALFVSFFPQIIQGPISRYEKLSETLYGEHAFDPVQIRSGLMRIAWGFFKKLVIADRLLAAVKTLALKPEDYQGAYVVLIILFYAIQLYADFTGGIDITIGVGEIFGIKMEENFITPYFSKNINEYWTRWHITMGTWFKDYIFYPLSVSQPMLKLSKWSRDHMGKAVGKRVTVYIANIVVWFATGLWHGAAWNFIVWGMLNCVVTVASYEMEPLYKKFHAALPCTNRGWYNGFQMLRTFWLMGAIRILDVYRSVPTSFRQVGTIFTAGGWGSVFSADILKLGLTGADYLAVLVGCILMIAVSIVRYRQKDDIRVNIEKRGVVCVSAVILLLVFAVLIFGAYGVGYDASQFIYNQF